MNMKGGGIIHAKAPLLGECELKRGIHASTMARVHSILGFLASVQKSLYGLIPYSFWRRGGEEN